ncbi:MFS transporter [Kribbella steppae]|uniref:MFS transporter n=1 Tax=Kribbella steppae TaxID=2512223 RepID=A0A4R2HKC8_9ACTN|nr:MFS transporter [Kribbella steppae]TCO30418.1 MFS transporter [Kribbella steppae]
MKQEMHKLSRARQLLTILSAQSASTYANQVIALVIPWLILTRTGSAASAGAVAFAMGIAALAGTLVGGLVTDRIGGRRVSILADSLSMITALTLAVTLSFDFFALWLVAVTQVLGVFFDGPGQIAKVSTVPEAAKEEDVPITRAMGLTQTLQGVAMFVGPITAGLLIAAFGEANTLFVTTVLFLTSIVLASRLRKKVLTHEHPMSAQQTYRDLREAVDFLVKEPFLGKMQLVGPLMGAVIVPISALVFPAWFIFAKQDSRALGIFLGAGAIGGMVGGVLFAALGQKLAQRTWLVSATAFYAVALLGLYFLQPGSVLAVGVSFVAGLMLSVMFAVPFTAFYSRTPQELLGRVGSLGAAHGSLMGALASLGFGWLMHTVSAPTALLVCALIMGGITAALAFMPFMRLLDNAAEPQDAEPEPAVNLPVAATASDASVAA